MIKVRPMMISGALERSYSGSGGRCIGSPPPMMISLNVSQNLGRGA
jgi:hypothetical protein